MLVPLGAASVGHVDDVLPATVAYVLAYGVMNLGAFAVVTLVGRHRPANRLADYRALGRTEPLTAFALAFALACLAGLPPGLLGLFAKVVVFRAPVDQGVGWLAVVMAVNVVIGLYYYLAWAASLYVPLRPGARARRRTGSPGPTAWRSASRSVPRCGSRWRPAWCCGSAERASRERLARRTFADAAACVPATVHRHANGAKTAVLLAAAVRADPARGAPGSAAAAA